MHITTILANLIYDKADESHVCRIGTIKQELWNREEKKQLIELDEEQEKNPYDTLLMRYKDRRVKTMSNANGENGQYIVMYSNMCNIINTLLVIMK